MHTWERNVHKRVKETAGESQRSCIEAERYTESGNITQECQLTMVTNLEAGRSPQGPQVSAGVFKTDVSCKLEGLIFLF